MVPHFFEAEFHDLHVELSKQSLQQFINKMMEYKCSLYWRYNDDIIYLIIDTNHSIHEIPFEKNGTKLTITVDCLKVSEELVAKALELIMKEYRGSGFIKTYTEGPHYITFFKDGVIQSITEIHGGEKIVMNQYGAIIEYRDFDHDLDPETIINILNLEIDYTLMELYESLQALDNYAIKEQKRKLKLLSKRKKEIEQLL
ncbi:hypothetical protein BKP45_12845 [Anaerobacillus alkalidiazotrophicus]|uniref:Uncharacterized protein n=1 Tax=Anaerobacillus alkalidiazotrophicus TaxID=472963 RepID=A0A1S2M5I4_9BACI|nr:hypothetical protein [Anaerobacillus alkalidiazotrophicus]OIJ18452.1 hypothetical protein BKP45_18560 [Anaerobacillus alkalidiazotrophicus]OIJ19931.1 hypothetical protein BKP45_12845 [Anaerobacillus alkalidiazotrophicus]